MQTAILQRCVNLCQFVFHFLGNRRIKIMEGSQTGAAEEVAARERTLVGEGDQLNDASGDQLHGAGDEAGVSRRQGFPLVGVHADAEECCASAFRRSDFLQSAIARVAAGAKDYIRALIQRLAGRAGAPFGIAKGCV